MSKATVLTNDLLKGVMTDALVRRGSVTDIDTTTTPGVYTVEPSRFSKGVVFGIPSTYRYGTLLVLGNEMFITQIYIPHQSYTVSQYVEMSNYTSDLALRVRYEGVWTKWRLITAHTS